MQGCHHKCAVYCMWQPDSLWRERLCDRAKGRLQVFLTYFLWPSVKWIFSISGGLRWFEICHEFSKFFFNVIPLYETFISLVWGKVIHLIITTWYKLTSLSRKHTKNATNSILKTYILLVVLTSDNISYSNEFILFQNLLLEILH